jgi:hypothetical protein
MIAAAEKIAGLSFTDAERDLMLDNLNNTLQSFTQLRTISIPNHVPPAIQFSPVLAGRVPPPVGEAGEEGEAAGSAAASFRFRAGLSSVTALADLLRRRKVTRPSSPSSTSLDSSATIRSSSAW